MFDLTVNIATAGRPDLLAQTLHSLAQCRLPANYKQTMVIENGPQSGAQAVVRSAPAVLNARYLYCPRANKSAALNAALGIFGDGLVFFTDDDVRLDPGVLIAYANAAETNGPGHFFGGPTEADYEQRPSRWLLQYLPNSVRGWHPPDDCLNEAQFLGFNWAAFAADLRAAGGFNPDRGPGSVSGSTGQESDMQRRLLKLGLLGAYVPAAVVWHYVPRDRCSEQWAINRNFRHGVEGGARIAARTRPLRLPPWWVIGKYLKGIARCIVRSVSLDPERRFAAKFHHNYDRGLLYGIRYQRQLNAKEAANSPAPATIAPVHLNARHNHS